MAKYQAHSISVVSSIKDISTETFQTIGKLDKASRKLSGLLDEKIKEISLKKSVSKAEIQEADLLRKAIETISAGKVQLAVKNYDLIDQNIKIVDHEIALLEKALIENGEAFQLEDNTIIGSSSSSMDKNSSSQKKRKHDKTTGAGGAPEAQVDPNEPLYCICNRIAFGEMIACDNEDCPIEWFHYPCVNLTRKPRNSWICQTCAYRRKKLG
jgi:inhibitor of growth protein 5